MSNLYFLLAQFFPPISRTALELLYQGLGHIWGEGVLSVLEKLVPQKYGHIGPEAMAPHEYEISAVTIIRQFVPHLKNAKVPGTRRGSGGFAL